MKATKTKWRKVKQDWGPRVQSPTWGALQRMADAVTGALGGPAGAANKLSAESFYALSILASLNLDEQKSAAFIFGKEWLQ